MANLGQLAQIRGAVQGYDAGKMNEQQLQQWLINFKETQRQFNTQSGQQQGYLDIAKDESKENLRGLKVKNNYQIQIYKELIDSGVPAKQAELQAQEIANQTFEAVGQSKVNQSLADKFPDIYEYVAKGRAEAAKYGAGSPERAYNMEMAKLGQQQAITRQQQTAADIGEQTKQGAITQSNVAAQTAQAQFNALMQMVDGRTLFDQSALNAIEKDFATIQYLVKQGNLMEANTTARNLQNEFQTLIQEGGRKSESFKAQQAQTNFINQKIQQIIDETGIGQFEAETRRMSVNLAKEAKEKLDAAGERGYSDSTVNVLFKDMLDSRTELEEQIFDALESPLTKEQIGMMDNWIKAYKQTYNNTAAMLSGAGLGLVIDWTEQPLNVRQSRKLWLDKDVPKTLPYPRSTRVMTPEEQAAYAEKGTIPAFGVKEQPSAETLRRPTTTTPTTTTGLTPEVRQQYIDRVKQAPDAEISAIQTEFLGKYSNAEWNKIIRESMK